MLHGKMKITKAVSRWRLNIQLHDQTGINYIITSEHCWITTSAVVTSMGLKLSLSYTEFLDMMFKTAPGLSSKLAGDMRALLCSDAL